MYFPILESRAILKSQKGKTKTQTKQTSIKEDKIMTKLFKGFEELLSDYYKSFGK